MTSRSDPPPLKWLSTGFGGSRSEEEAATQQVKLDSAVHGALEQFEAVDLPFVLPTAPGQAKASANGSPNLIEADGETFDHLHVSNPGVGRPSIEGGDDARLGLRAAAASMNDPTEPAAEVDDLNSFVILQHTRDRSSDVGIDGNGYGPTC